jgi:hypothetical protein
VGKAKGGYEILDVGILSIPLLLLASPPTVYFIDILKNH